MFFEKYGSLALYDEDLNNICTINSEDINFIKEYCLRLIENTNESDGTSTDYEYFSICNDLFEIVYSTNNDVGILIKIIFNNVSLPTSK